MRSKEGCFFRISLIKFFRFFLTALCAGIFVFTCWAPETYGQVLGRTQPASSFNPVGSGARALGMGGAFIAVADDATAASWNPGGLIQLEKPEISMVISGVHQEEDNTFGLNPEASGEQWIEYVDINYLSAVYPFSFAGKNMVVSLNYQTLYDMNREWSYPFYRNSGGLSYTKNVDYEQKGILAALGLAYCIRFSPRFSLGITLNTWDHGLLGNEWEEIERQTGSGTNLGNAFTSTTYNAEKYEFSGYNANIGFLWRVSPKFTVGGVLKAPFKADLRHVSSSSENLHYPASPGSDVVTPLSSTTEDETLDMPISGGIGLSYRFSDVFTASFDVYRTEWGDFIRTDAHGNKTSFVSGKPDGESDVDATHQVRVGTEYLFLRPHHVVPLRCGLFYDPAPAEGSPDAFYGVSVGSGIAKGRFVFDIAYQYRFGNDVGTSIIQDLDFSQDVEEHTAYFSLILHF